MTEALLVLCNELYKKSEVYELAWSQDIKYIYRFVKNNGTVSFAKVKVPGVYILFKFKFLFLPDTNHTYVDVGVIC